MKIYLGTDHAGFQLKEKIKAFLLEKAFEVEDCGALTFDKDDDYPDFIAKTAIRVSENPNSKGVVFGKSGAGECIVANKIKGIRAILGFSSENVELSRFHNDANVLSLGSMFSFIEVLPLVLLIIEAIEQRHMIKKQQNFPYRVAYTYVIGAAFWNFIRNTIHQ